MSVAAATGKGGDVVVVESEEDEEVSMIMAKKCEESKAERPSRAVVVVTTTGEASESEEEEVNSATNRSSYRDSVVDVLESGRGEVGGARKHEPIKYKTLLHKKLRERNVSLQRNLAELMCHPYQAATHDMNNLAQQLSKTQLLIQDLAPTLRQLTNDLFHLEDKVDLVHDCANLLPELKPEMKTVEM